MKKLKLIILLLLLQFSINAQTYFPLLDSNSIWTGSALSQGVIKSIYKNGIFGDTIINNVSYYKTYYNTDYNFDLSNSFYLGAIRESNKQVFIIKAGWNSELPLYDFNLNIGDTAKSANSIGQVISMKVDSIDSVIIDGLPHKRWKFNALGLHPNEYWIEGIGSSLGFYLPLWRGTDNCYALVCVSKNGLIIYQNLAPSCGPPAPYDCDGTYNTTSIYGYLTESTKTIIFPNPFSNSAILKTSIDLNDATLTIYDILGQEVLTNSHLNGQEIKITKGNLSNGNYYYHLTQNSDLISKGKFIVE